MYIVNQPRYTKLEHILVLLAYISCNNYCKLVGFFFIALYLFQYTSWNETVDGITTGNTVRDCATNDECHLKDDNYKSAASSSDYNSNSTCCDDRDYCNAAVFFGVHVVVVVALTVFALLLLQNLN